MSDNYPAGVSDADFEGVDPKKFYVECRGDHGCESHFNADEVDVEDECPDCGMRGTLQLVENELWEDRDE